MSKISLAIVLSLMSVLASAQQQLYRYIDKDGRVVYTDAVPPHDAKSVQRKKLGGNFIETGELPYALQAAQQRNPVTLYSGACGALCDQARALLNRRGVPHRDIDPSLPGEMQKMKQVTGDNQVPVLVVGAAILLKGFEEEKWQAALDQVGYPKTPQVRVTALKREADKAAADKATGKTVGKGDSKGTVKDDTRGEAVPDAAPETRK
jgi:glutaredoxin